MKNKKLLKTFDKYVKNRTKKWTKEDKNNLMINTFALLKDIRKFLKEYN